MSVMTYRASVAANTTTSNILAGQIHEFVPRASIVKFYGSSAAVGLNATFLVAGVSQVQDQELNAQNRMPIIPDDLVCQTVAPAGSRLSLYLRNTTGAAIVGFARVDVDPL